MVLRREVASTRSELEALKSQAAADSRMVQEMATELDQSAAATKEAQQHVVHLRNLLVEATAAKDTVDKKVTILVAQGEKDASEITSSFAQLSILEAQVRKDNEAVTALHKQQVEVNEQLTMMTNEYNSYRTLTEGHLAQLRDELSVLHQERQSLVKDADIQLTTKLQNLQVSTAKGYEERIHNDEQNIIALQDQLKQLCNNELTQKDQISALESRLLVLQQEHEAHLESCVDNVSTLQAQIRAITQENSLAENEIAELRQERQDMREEAALAGDRAQEQLQVILSLEQQGNDKQREITMLRTMLDDVSGRSLDDSKQLQAQLNTLKSDIETRQLQYEKTTLEMTVLHAAQMEDLNRLLSLASTSKEQEKEDNYQLQLAAMRVEHEQAMTNERQAMASLTNANEFLHCEAKVMKQTFDTLVAEYEEYRDVNASHAVSLRTQLAGAEDDKRELGTKMILLRAEADDLRERLANLEEKKDRFQRGEQLALSQLESQLSNVHRDYQTYQETAGRQREADTNEIASLSTEIVSLTAQLNLATASRSASDKQLEEAEVKTKKDGAVIASMRNQIRKITDENDLTEAEVTSLQQQTKELSSQLQALAAEFQGYKDLSEERINALADDNATLRGDSASLSHDLLLLKLANVGDSQTNEDTKNELAVAQLRLQEALEEHSRSEQRALDLTRQLTMLRANGGDDGGAAKLQLEVHKSMLKGLTDEYQSYKDVSETDTHKLKSDVAARDRAIKALEEELGDLREMGSATRVAVMGDMGWQDALTPHQSLSQKQTQPAASTTKNPSVSRTAVRRAVEELLSHRGVGDEEGPTRVEKGGTWVPEGMAKEAQLAAQGFAAKRAAIQLAVDQALYVMAGGSTGSDFEGSLASLSSDRDAMHLQDLRTGLPISAGTPPRLLGGPQRHVSSSAMTIVSASLGLPSVTRETSMTATAVAPLAVSEDYMNAYGVNPAKTVLLRNQEVLWQIYIFYSFHAATVKFTRTTGKGNVALPTSPTPARTPALVASLETRHDKKLLSQSDFLQLFRDFRLLAVDTNVTWLETFLDHPSDHSGGTSCTTNLNLTSSHASLIVFSLFSLYYLTHFSTGNVNILRAFSHHTSSSSSSSAAIGYGDTLSQEVKLSFREFLRCLLKIGDERIAGEAVASGLAETLLRVLETMDLSEQGLILERTGLLEGPLTDFEYDPSACFDT